MLEKEQKSVNAFYWLRVAEITRETRDAVVVTFAVPDALRERFRFSAGQYLTLRALVDGEEVRRSYSICSAPYEEVLRIAVKRVQDGVFSTWAHRELQVGHEVECMAPAGKFGLPAEPGARRNYLAFAAGSGITPIVSIMKTVLEEEPGSRFTLVYGNRASSSVIFKEELLNLKDQYLERLSLVFILSRERGEIELFNGRIDGAKTRELLGSWVDAEELDVTYLCGPQAMIEGVRDALEAHGVAREKIRSELFGTGAVRAPRMAAQAAGNAERECVVTVVQDGRERRFTMAREANVLESALAQGVELPYSCRAGVCSTCRCKRTAGEVEMDANFALEDYEVARGFMLTCQSYALSTELVLDFDQES